MALVQLQQPEMRVEGLRKRLLKSVGDKHEETMARMGAVIATGASQGDSKPTRLGGGSHRKMGFWPVLSQQQQTPLAPACSFLGTQASWTLAGATRLWACAPAAATSAAPVLWALRCSPTTGAGDARR